MTTSSPQVAVVTGANSGIGRATALHLAQQGYRVFGTVRSIEKAGKLQSRATELGIIVELIEMDVADDASVQRGFADIFRTTDRVDVLVNNAGIGGNGVVEESTPQMYHDAFNVNVVGAIRCTQQVLPNMRARKSGTIVNITSVVGKFAAVAQAPYVASKWAFEGVSEELAQEVAPFGIRVVIIEPGVTKSSIFPKISTHQIKVAHTIRTTDACSRFMPQELPMPLRPKKLVHLFITPSPPTHHSCVTRARGPAQKSLLAAQSSRIPNGFPWPLRKTIRTTSMPLKPRTEWI